MLATSAFRMNRKPLYRPSGTVAYFARESLARKHEEAVFILSLITDRKLFGEVYCGLQPDYFFDMPRNSGVVVAPLALTSNIAPTASRPGDIDILIIPYEGRNLIVNKTIAVEVKIVRASYEKQSKSPNDYGFSQARALCDVGFPFVAVAHLICSDSSPREAWREVMQTQIIGPNGRCREPTPCVADMLPADLMWRTYGRLKANCDNRSIGLVSAFLEPRLRSADGKFLRSPIGMWLPECRPAIRTNDIPEDLAVSIFQYYERNTNMFMNNPRFDPPKRLRQQRTTLPYPYFSRRVRIPHIPE